MNPAPKIEEAETGQADPSLRASMRDGVSHAVMLGAGETYLGPFGIFLQASTLQVGNSPARKARGPIERPAAENA